ncbi:MAG: hypothetical protein ACR2IE_17765 [Candidatus Sumerlaeaceae bacterium]
MPKRIFTLRSFTANLTVAIVCFGFLVACDQDIEINPEFSVNIFKPGPKWPNVKKLAAEQREAYEKFGKPDCFHVYWSPTGEIMPRRELEKQLKGKKPKTVPPFSWVYLRTNKEVVFPGGGRANEQPLPETVRIVAENGDPEDVSQEGGGITQWMFYSTGKIYKISQGRVIERKEFPAMGRYIK